AHVLSPPGTGRVRAARLRGRVGTYSRTVRGGRMNSSWMRPNLTTADLGVLKCPKPNCPGGLIFAVTLGSPIDDRGDRPLAGGTLECQECKHGWRVHHGCPDVLESGLAPVSS